MTHSSFSSIVVVSFFYVLAGLLFLDIYVEHLLLASVVVVICGILPDVDGSDDSSVREITAFLGAIAPLIVIEIFPSLLGQGGITRVALVIICAYLLTRLVINRVLRKYFKPKGMLHSVPAAIITGELVYLLFWDLSTPERIYISFAAFVGYFSHLMMEAYGNLDLVGGAMGKAKKHTPVLKFSDGSMGRTLFIYGSMFFLGYIVLRDFYPGLPPVPYIS